MNKLSVFFHKSSFDKINSIKYKYYLFKTQYIYKSAFKELGRGTFIIKPLKILNHKYIIIKDEVSIWQHARIEAIEKYNNKEFLPLINIEHGVSIQQNVHLTCANSVFIGCDTAIAANVTITDIHHPYENIEVPIEKQDIIYKEVFIGSECKIYNNSVILPGVHIGNHCTIGANSVVNRNIPEYSVAVGIPARVIKRYNFKTKAWEKTTEDGEFLNE